MPTLPSVESLGRRPTPQPGRAIASVDGVAPALATANLGGTLQGIALNLQQEQQQMQAAQQRATAALALAKTSNDLHDAHDEIQRGVMSGEIETQKAGDVLSQRLASVRETGLSALSDEQKSAIAPNIESTVGGLQRSLAGSVYKRQQSDVAGAIDQFGEQAQRDVPRLGPKWAVEKYSAFVDFNGSVAGLSPAVQQKLKQSFKETAYVVSFDANATQALAAGDLEKLRDLRSKLGGPEGEPIDPLKRDALTRQIMGFESQVIADQQRAMGETRYGIVSRAKDVQSMVMSGVTPPEGVAPTVKEYVALHGANGESIWQQEVGNFLQIGGAIQQLKIASAPDRAAIVAAAKPEAGEGFTGKANMRDALVQANALVERQIMTDPAAYALQNSPRVTRAARVMQEVLIDPKMPPEDKIAATDFYARTTIAEQERLGVDAIRDEKTGNKMRGPKILTNQQANAIADQFNDQTKGGQNAAQLVGGLEAQYGKYWPQVYGQLATDNKLPPAALVIPNMQNDASRSRMAQASIMKADDLKALVEPTDPKDIRDSLLSEFDRAQRTFVAQGTDGNKTLATVISEAEKLALLYRSQGKSPKDSARQAYTEVMGWKYEFADTYRVPKENDAKAVSLGAAQSLRDIKAEDVTAFAGGAVPTVITEDALRTRAMWINTPDETGLRLMLRGSDGGVYAVQDKFGKPIEFGWPQLQMKAKEAKAPAIQRLTDQEELRRRQEELNPRR